MLSEASKASIRRTVLKSLTDTCDIYETDGTPDGLGSETLTPSVALANEPCRVVSPKPADIVQFADVLKGKQLVTFQFRDSTAISLSNHIVYKSKKYKILGIKAPVTDQFVLPVHCMALD